MSIQKVIHSCFSLKYAIILACVLSYVLEVLNSGGSKMDLEKLLAQISEADDDGTVKLVPCSCCVYNYAGFDD